MVSLVAFEYVAVAVAMPVVARELGGFELYGLAFSSALAAGVVGTVLGGRWADVRGPLPPLWTGAAAFIGGLTLAGLAPTMEVLIAGRLIQGFGGALVNVALYVVVARVYPEELHPRVFSLFATAWVVPSMVGAGDRRRDRGDAGLAVGVPAGAVPDRGGRAGAGARAGRAAGARRSGRPGAGAHGQDRVGGGDGRGGGPHAVRERRAVRAAGDRAGDPGRGAAQAAAPRDAQGRQRAAGGGGGCAAWPPGRSSRPR
ncbi:MFS transporter [Nonomuraea ferruginea]